MTQGQREILQAMANGHVMRVSNDGEMCWLFPPHSSGLLGDDERTSLMIVNGWIERIQSEPDEDGWIDVHCKITQAGREALL